VRPSYFAFKYLAQRGYDMIPVNPGHVGKSLLGKPFVASLTDIGRPVDMIDIFRNSSHIMPVVDEALKLSPLPKVIWMQLGARDDAAAEKAEAAGLKVVMNRCPKIEYGRLSSEISWMGVNSRTLSSKRAPIPEMRQPRNGSPFARYPQDWSVSNPRSLPPRLDGGRGCHQHAAHFEPAKPTGLIE
jgi:predicted CoA-binding protein